MEMLQQNLLKIRSRIIAACEACQRNPNEIELLPVTKNHSLDMIVQLVALELKRFGENYGQEMFAKAEATQHLDIQWVFIGQLQTNKIRKIVATAAEIQSVTCLKHAQVVARCAEEFGKTPFPIYLSVNAGDEDSKGGVALDAVQTLAAQIIHELPTLRLKGLMAIPPPLSDQESLPGVVPKLYRELASLAKTIGEGQLSLGMSGDLEPAIAAGSTCVRIGTALLGKRGNELL
jgi:pyridoxal phosphate enzyme (YggS family)